ncbi:nuclear transport factor 2 family protein [Paraburkholderia strydomiana]|uniref:nuclear transport factor 2 family protein n=1 Tax=Paraburkholderia strydomiana TaxID=1245417 RepID=UPI0038BABF54
MSTTVDRYFSLVDTAMQGREQLEALVELFADEAILAPAVGEEVSGKAAIRQYLSDFYTNIASENCHFYRTTSDDGRHVEADWAVAGKLRQGGLVALQGHNVFKIGSDGKIQSLRVKNAE